MNRKKQYAMALLVCGALVSFAFPTSADTKQASTAAGGAAAASDGYVSTTVQELAQTERLKDRKVQFEAVVSKVGCVGCGGVTMVDKTWRISVCPEDPSSLKIPTTAGTRVRIWGVLSIVDDFREVKAQRVEKL